MKVAIVGCGRMGADLADRMYHRGHEVVIIDLNEDAFNNLPADFQGRFYEGDALNLDVLNRAGLETCDALAAVTNEDEMNLVISHIGREHFHIPRIVARNYDPHNRVLYETFNIQIVSAISWAAQRLEEMIYHEDVRTVFSAGNGEIEVYEVRVPKLWTGQPLGLLNPCNDCLTISLTRSGHASIPNPQTILHADDLLHLSATVEGIEELRQRLVKKPEEV